jgi:glucose dehydrogenase
MRIIFLSLFIFGITYSSLAQKGFSLVDLPASKKVEVQYDGKLFTAYCYFDSTEKPVLFPIKTTSGVTITRGYPIVPRPGEPGIETWERESWKDTGSAKAWSLMSADEELGYLYVPLSSAANEWYGGQRPGANLYSDSLVCLDARTGERKWHYQMVHHDLWDYDNPTAPVLADITVGGRRIKAVIQVTKQAFAFVFDRVTGEPVWPIEERPVPASKIPGEKLSEIFALVILLNDAASRPINQMDGLQALWRKPCFFERAKSLLVSG